MLPDFEWLTVEKRGGALWVRMDEASDLSQELTQVFRSAHCDPEIRVVVLTGAKERAFCVGGGGVATPQDETSRKAYWIQAMRRARDVVLSALDCDKPIVGRINGHAVGKGCSLALCCDITVMVEDAKIGDSHVKVGLAAGDGGSLLWPDLVGLMRARRHLLTGDLLTGREAAAIGLVTEAVPRAELDARTEHWVERLAQAAPAALAMTKRALNAAMRRQATAHMDMSLGFETLSFMTQDHLEGAAALREKREPIFTGR